MTIQIPEAFAPLFTPSRYKAYHGGRGSAKTHSFGTAGLLLGAQHPLRIGVYREVQKSIRDSIKRLLDDKIAAIPELTGFYDSTDSEIRGANGTLFIFGGLRSNPDAVKSTEGLDIAMVVEANRVSQRSWDMLIPTVRKAGSEIWAEWNPEKADDPVDAMFRGESGPPPGSMVREVSWRDNPWFPDELRQQMEYDRKRDFDKYQWIWEGKYLQRSDSRVFNNWRVEDFKAPSDAVFRFGADWGFSIDPTVLIRCHIEGRTLYIDYEAYLVGCEIDNTPALFDSVPDSRRHLITADSARPETVSYMQRQGFRIVSAIKGPGSVEDGVEFMKSFDIVVHPRCRHTIDELQTFSYKTDPLTNVVLSELADKDNHVIDAARYALEGARRAALVPSRKVQLALPKVAAGGWMSR